MTTFIIIYAIINLTIIACEEPLTSQSPIVNLIGFVVLFFTALPIFIYRWIVR
jgi:hypothetical protein